MCVFPFRVSVVPQAQPLVHLAQMHGCAAPIVHARESKRARVVAPRRSTKLRPGARLTRAVASRRGCHSGGAVSGVVATNGAARTCSGGSVEACAVALSGFRFWNPYRESVDSGLGIPARDVARDVRLAAATLSPCRCSACYHML